MSQASLRETKRGIFQLLLFGHETLTNEPFFFIILIRFSVPLYPTHPRCTSTHTINVYKIVILVQSIEDILSMFVEEK